MRAFLVTWRAIVSYYSEMFFLLGISLAWWATGGAFVVLAAWLGIGLLAEGPWWMAPLFAIPIGPATAALAVVARRCARGTHVDRSYYMAGLRALWRQGLVLSAIGMTVLALLLLNVLFYAAQSNSLLAAFSVFWAYLAVFWLAVQFYAYPVLGGMEQPNALSALRTAALIAFANPLYSALLVVSAGVLTALSVALAILVFFAWPAVMALLGEHAVRLVLVRAGVIKEEG